MNINHTFLFAYVIFAYCVQYDRLNRRRLIVLRDSVHQSAGATTSSVHGRQFHGVDSSPVNTIDGQEIAAVLAEPLQTRYGEDGSFIGQYSSRQHRLDQPILEELEETTSGDRASDDTSDYACTTGI